MRLYKASAQLLAVAACWLILCSLPLTARALSPDRPIAHFSHVWFENQLPQTTVRSITQQGDESIWISTYAGLVRYSGDGFETIDTRVSQQLKSSAITAVASGEDRQLWVGTLNGGLYRLKDRRLQPVALPEGIDSVLGIVHDSEGALWLTTNRGVVRIQEGQIRLLDDADGFPPRGFYRGMVADRLGSVWIAADGVGVIHWRQGQARLYTEADGLPSNAVYSLTVDAHGRAWAGTQSGPAFFEGGRFHRDPVLRALDGKRIFTIYGDRAGTVWFAPLDMGVCRLVGDALDCVDDLAGMHAETVRSMFEDREGNLWFGTTSSGLHKLSQSKIVTVLGKGPSNAIRAAHQMADGQLVFGTDGGGLMVYRSPSLQPLQALNRQLPSQLIRAITQDDRGRMWVAGTEGVTRFSVDGKARHFGITDGMPGTIAFAFAPSRQGGMWVGTLQGVARIDDGDTVHVLEAARGDDTRALHESADGRLWIGLRSGLRCFHKGKFDQCGTDGLPGTSVFAFHDDGKGTLWLGTSMGIVRISGGRTTRYLQNAGFHGDAVFVLFDDGQGSFWFSSNRGIGRLSKADLAALDAGKRSSIEPQWYGTADGMLNAQANGASQSPGTRTADGRMWFGTAKGVAVVDPEQMRGNPLPPPVVIERLIGDGEPVDLTVGVPQLAPGTQRLEFQFAGMSFVAPDGVRYRYLLEGFDRDWRDAGNGRRAHYTNLPPGRYVFRVMASNNDGVWNDSGAQLTFRMLPQWYQTWWWYLLVAGSLVMVVWGLVGLRLRASRQRERHLTEEVARRTEQLRMANVQLEQVAAQDALTGIANRREFNRRFVELWEACGLTHAPLSVLLVDVDEFKAYNDAHGHLAGDATLAAVAGLLSLQLGASDCLAARYGGEEFALLLPGHDRSAATRVAEACVRAIHQQGMPHHASRVCGVVTVSIGVATQQDGRYAGPEVLLHAADGALYRAKECGRNGVQVA